MRQTPCRRPMAAPGVCSRRASGPASKRGQRGAPGGYGDFHPERRDCLGSNRGLNAMLIKASRRELLRFGAVGAAAGSLPAAAFAAEDSWAHAAAIAAAVKPPVFPDRVFDVTAHGAKG